MSSINIQQHIFDALELANHAREDDKQITISADLELFGTEGCLDSMELVGLLISIEESLLDEDIEISLSDEKAMSQSNSPFKNVASLTQYIESLISAAS